GSPEAHPASSAVARWTGKIRPPLIMAFDLQDQRRRASTRAYHHSHVARGRALCRPSPAATQSQAARRTSGSSYRLQWLLRAGGSNYGYCIPWHDGATCFDNAHYAGLSDELPVACATKDGLSEAGAVVVQLRTRIP